MFRKVATIGTVLLMFSLSIAFAFSVNAQENDEQCIQGMSRAYLETLTNDELNALFEPFRAIAKAIYAEFGFKIIPWDASCSEWGRPAIIRALTNYTLEEIEIMAREHAREHVHVLQLREKTVQLQDEVVLAYLDGIICGDLLIVLHNEVAIVAAYEGIEGIEALLDFHDNVIRNLETDAALLNLYPVDMDIIELESHAITRIHNIRRTSARLGNGVFIRDSKPILQSKESVTGWRNIRYTASAIVMAIVPDIMFMRSLGHHR